MSKETPAAGDVAMPVVAYLRATPDGKPVWAEDCVCEDAIWPMDDDFGNESSDVSMPLVKQSDAQAALAAKDADYALGVSMLTKKIAALTAERDAALAASRYETDLCGQALADLKEMAAKRDALRKDAGRLDYLAATTTWTHSGDGFYSSHVSIEWGDSIKRRPLRAAIDAAMTKDAANPAD